MVDVPGSDPGDCGREGSTPSLSIVCALVMEWQTCRLEVPVSSEVRVRLPPSASCLGG